MMVCRWSAGRSTSGGSRDDGDGGRGDARGNPSRRFPCWPGYLTMLQGRSNAVPFRTARPKSFRGRELRLAVGNANHARREPPPPPKRITYFVNTTPDFFHPSSPHTPRPPQTRLSAVRESRTLPVSPLGSGQISGQLFSLSPRSAVALLATTGLGSRPKSRPRPLACVLRALIGREYLWPVVSAAASVKAHRASAAALLVAAANHPESAARPITKRTARRLFAVSRVLHAAVASAVPKARSAAAIRLAATRMRSAAGSTAVRQTNVALVGNAFNAGAIPHARH